MHYVREPRPDEPGADWIHEVQAERAAILNANVAILVASYIRLLGHEARAHTLTATEVDLNRLGVAAGLCIPDPATGDLVNPFVGHRFGLAAVTTTLELAPDLPLDPGGADLAGWTRRLEWATGWGGVQTASGLARLDDALDRGVINPVKTWWWDIELDKERTRYVEAAETNRRFPLDESATLSILMAGGIGVTPLIAMAHRLHALRRPFLFHYSARTEERSGFASVLRAMPWAESVLFHFSREGGRAR